MEHVPVAAGSRQSLAAILATCSLLLAGCSGTSAVTAPPASTTEPSKPGAVVAGMQIGNMPTAAAGWMPPAKISPVNPLPAMFQSVGDAPAQPGAKVRVFFLGMQW
jgi:hypothetical protein